MHTFHWAAGLSLPVDIVTKTVGFESGDNPANHNVLLVWVIYRHDDRARAATIINVWNMISVIERQKGKTTSNYNIQLDTFVSELTIDPILYNRKDFDSPDRRRDKV